MFLSVAVFVTPDFTIHPALCVAVTIVMWRAVKNFQREFGYFGEDREGRAALPTRAARRWVKKRSLFDHDEIDQSQFARFRLGLKIDFE